MSWCLCFCVTVCRPFNCDSPECVTMWPGSGRHGATACLCCFFCCCAVEQTRSQYNYFHNNATQRRATETYCGPNWTYEIYLQLVHTGRSRKNEGVTERGRVVRGKRMKSNGKLKKKKKTCCVLCAWSVYAIFFFKERRALQSVSLPSL